MLGNYRILLKCRSNRELDQKFSMSKVFYRMSHYESNLPDTFHSMTYSHILYNIPASSRFSVRKAYKFAYFEAVP